MNLNLDDPMVSVLAISILLTCANAANADTANWVGGSGTYDTSQNWDIADVPCIETRPITENAIIPSDNIVVSQDVTICSVSALTIGADATFGLLSGNDYNATNADIAGTISGSGNLTVLNTKFVGPQARVFGSDGAEISLANATNNATDTRFTAASGAEVTIQADIVTSTGPANSNITVLSANGTGSILGLQSVATINSSFNSTLGNAQFHQVVASDGGVINLSGLNLVTGPSDDEDYLTFSVSDSASINLDNLQTVNAGGYVLFDAVAGGTISLPLLQNTLDAFFLVDDPGSQIFANASAWTFSSIGRNNINSTLIRAMGTGSVADLSGMTELNAGFNSTLGNAQFHQVVASDGGVVKLSNLNLVTGPIDDEDYLTFSVSDSASINLDNLQTINAGGYVLFDAVAGGTISLPLLQNTLDAFFLADDPGSQIFANASAWTFSSIGRNNINSTLIRAMGTGAVADLSGMTELNAGFNSTLGNAQFHQVVASDGGVVDLSGLNQVIGPSDDEDFLSFSVSDSASINLDNLQTVNAGGYVLFDAVAGGTISLPSLQNTLDAFFRADDPDSQILANASAWTFSSIGRNNINSTLIRAMGTGAVADLSGMTELNAGFNSTLGNTQFHQVVASDGGVIDLSGLNLVTGPSDDEDYLTFSVSDSASINLDNLQTVNAGGYVLFDAVAGGAISLPSLQNTLDAFFWADEPDSQILANVSAWTFSSTGRNNISSTLIRAMGTGAVADLSGMTELNAGFNSTLGNTQFHQVVASDGGVIDLSGLNLVTGPSDDEDYLTFSVSDSASINLDNLQTVNAGGYVLFDAVAGGAISLPSLQNTTDAFFWADEPDSQILANVSAWTFSSTGRNNISSTLIRAMGTGAVVDLSGMTELNAGFNSTLGNTQFHQVVASDGGVIDLSGLNSISGPLDQEDDLRIVANTGGTLVLGSLANVTDGRNVSLALTAAQAVFPLSLDADNTISVVADSDSTVDITGDFSFDHVDETRFNLEAATVLIEGSEVLDIEVGGSNEGTVPMTTPNFGIGQLVIGSAEQTTTARLVDVVDNGNGDTCGIAGVEREVLYLNGFDIGVNTDGLRILNGSTLVLSGLELYANVGGVLTHINRWLTPGVPLSFDGGFIELGMPFDIDQDGVADGVDNCVLEPNPDQIDTDGDGYGNACDADLNGDLFVNNLDLMALRATFFSTPLSPNWNPDADFNSDNVVNFIDLAIIRELFFTPPGPACPIPPQSATQTGDKSIQGDIDRLFDEFVESIGSGKNQNH